MRSSERIFLWGEGIIVIRDYKYSENIFIDNNRVDTADFLEYDGKIFVSLEEVARFNKKELYTDDGKNFFLREKTPQINYINDVCTPVSSVNCEIKENFEYDGISYKDAMLFTSAYPDKPHFAEIKYNLNGLYKKFTFEVIKLSEVDYETTLFWVLGEKEDYFDLKSFETVHKIDLDVTERQEIKLYFLSVDQKLNFAIVNAYLE